MNWVIRRSSPNEAEQFSTQVSSEWARTWLWTNRRLRSGVSPAAISQVASRRVVSVSSLGSYGTVIACRSTTQKIASWFSAAGDPGSGWLSTQRRIAPK